MAKANLKGMDVAQLLELRKKVDDHLLQRRTELETQLARLGARVVGGGTTSSPLKGRKVPAKYRLGTRTWAGRGQKPTWLVEAMRGSKKKLADSLIDKKHA